MRALIRIFSVMFSLGFAIFASAASAQITESEFIERMVAHKVAVEIFCTEFSIRDPDSAGMSTKVRGMLAARCKNHDASKVNQDGKFLEHHKLSKEKSIASQLAEIYGQFVPEQSADRGIIDLQNRVDATVARELDLPFNATAVERREVDMLEHVLDLTAREIQEDLMPPVNGIYERGRKLRPASDYIANSPSERINWSAEERERMVAVALRLEKNRALKLKLVKALNGPEIGRRATALLATSHFEKLRRTRAECFEALLHEAGAPPH